MARKIDPRNELLRGAFFYAMADAGYDTSKMSARVYNNTGANGLRRKMLLNFGFTISGRSAVATEIVAQSIRQRFIAKQIVEVKTACTPAGWAVYVKFREGATISPVSVRPKVVKARRLPSQKVLVMLKFTLNGAPRVTGAMTNDIRAAVKKLLLRRHDDVLRGVDLPDDATYTVTVR